jgi:hypothetical protein
MGTPQTGELRAPCDTSNATRWTTLIKQGESPIEAHKAVHGEPNIGEIESKETGWHTGSYPTV